MDKFNLAERFVVLTPDKVADNVPDTPTKMLFITPGEGTINEYEKARFD